MSPGLRLLVVALVVLFAAHAAAALPRFASREGAKCQSCHVNPSGGGMRSPFGVQYGRDELPVPTWASEFDLDDFSTQLTDFVSIGADFRTLFYYQQRPDTGSASSTNAFWQMQGDIYMNLRLAKKVSIYLDKGIYGGFEIYGLMNILPGNGFIKVGKFVPNYGLKTDDHTVFTREHTGFSAERGRAELTGGELGFSPGPVTISGGIFNARDGFGSGTGSNKAFLGRAEGIFKPSEDINVGIGGNVFTAKQSSDGRVTVFGGFASFSYENLTMIGEVDLIKNKLAGTTTNGFVTSLEASYVVTPGVDVKLGYDFFDADTDVKSGSRSRYSIGLEFFPISGVELRPVYRIMKEDPVDATNNEFHFLIHFYL